MLFKEITIADENLNIREGVDVLIRDDVISRIGTDIPGEGEEIYDGRNKLLIPAFVDAHAHLPMSLMRGYGENLSLSDWLNRRIFPFEAHLDGNAVYWASMLSIAEGIRFGIVSFSDMYYFSDEVARAVIHSGAKANISRAATQFDDDDIWEKPFFREAAQLYKDYNGAADGRILIDMSIHGEYTSTPKTVEQMADFTRELGAVMHIHVSETRKEHEECKQRRGMTPVRYFSELGALDTRPLLAHCVWLEEDDLEILKEKGATVAVNPVSNLKLASGVCDVDRLLKKGINVAIGTDSVASNNSLNFIEEMKFFCLATKGFTGDPAVVSPRDALRAATAGGAAAQGRTHTGLIREGWKADLTVIDTDRPYMVPVHDMMNNLIYSASGTDVVLTMADGRVLYRDGEFMTMDIERVKAEAAGAAEKILKEL